MSSSPSSCLALLRRAHIAFSLHRIYNPAFEQLREELHASETELALSLSLFILFQVRLGFSSRPYRPARRINSILASHEQGGMPVFWSAVGEIIGRKPVYLIAQTIFIVGTIVCSRANSMALLIVFRIIQACGSSAVLSLGAGTLADMFEVKERGKFMGYALPFVPLSSTLTIC